MVRSYRIESKPIEVRFECLGNMELENENHSLFHPLTPPHRCSRSHFPSAASSIMDF